MALSFGFVALESVKRLYDGIVDGPAHLAGRVEGLTFCAARTQALKALLHRPPRLSSWQPCRSPYNALMQRVAMQPNVQVRGFRFISSGRQRCLSGLRCGGRTDATDTQPSILSKMYMYMYIVPLKCGSEHQPSATRVVPSPRYGTAKPCVKLSFRASLRCICL